MRTALSILLLFAMQVGSLFADDFSAAGEAYVAGDFLKARELFQKQSEAAPGAAVFYNVGNACFRLGEMGPAALAYERALVLRPVYGEAAANLRLVREKAASRVEEKSWAQYFLTTVPLRDALWIGVALTWTGIVLLGWLMWRRADALPLLGTVFVIIAGLGYTAAIVWIAGIQQQIAIVTVEKAEAHIDPSERSSIADTLPAGSRVYCEGQQGAWIYCKLPNGAHGWVRTGEVERLHPAPKS